jgi:hypothetical protein
MSTAGKILLTGGLVVGGYFLFSYYRLYDTVKKLILSLKGVTMEAITSDRITIGIQLLVQNPGNQAVYVQEIDLNFFINGRFISKLRNPAQQVVYPGGISNLFFLADVHYASAGGELFNVIKNGTDYRIDISISGNLYANGLPIPVPRLNVAELSAKDLFQLWK